MSKTASSVMLEGTFDIVMELDPGKKNDSFVRNSRAEKLFSVFCHLAFGQSQPSGDGGSSQNHKLSLDSHDSKHLIYEKLNSYSRSGWRFDGN